MRIVTGGQPLKQVAALAAGRLGHELFVDVSGLGIGKDRLELPWQRTDNANGAEFVHVKEAHIGEARFRNANRRGSLGYTGPKPPVGDHPHHYYFQVFAVDMDTLGIEPGAKRDEVLKAMEGHVLAKGQLVGSFQRKLAAE